MRYPVALLAVAALAVGCTTKKPPLPPACIAGTADYQRALRAAPGDVRVGGTTLISECLRRIRNDAELQTLGVLLFHVADDLAAEARDRRSAALAERLGYLVGAARRGADRSNGVSAELAHRMEAAGAKLEDSGAEIQRALQAGVVAGRARG